MAKTKKKPAAKAKPATKKAAKPAKRPAAAKKTRSAKMASATKPKASERKVAAKPKAAGAKSAKPKPAAGGPAPEAGAIAPDFTLEGSDGKSHSLSALRGKHVVVYFYPKDDTPGCTREAQGFEAAGASFAKKNVVVFGVSKDSIASHCRFRDKYGLGFPLLSDTDLAVHRAYGAYGEKVMYGQKTIGVIRSTFLVGPDGRIERAWPRVKVDGHVDAVLAALPA